MGLYIKSIMSPPHPQPTSGHADATRAGMPCASLLNVSFTVRVLRFLATVSAKLAFRVVILPTIALKIHRSHLHVCSYVCPGEQQQNWSTRLLKCITELHKFSMQSMSQQHQQLPEQSSHNLSRESWACLHVLGLAYFEHRHVHLVRKACVLQDWHKGILLILIKYILV